MKINNKTLTYKINCTRLPCKVQCEHTEYTPTLIDENTCKENIYFSNSLREEEKKNKRQAPHNLAYITKCIALWTLYLPQSNVCEKQLELQQVSLIPFPHLDNICFVNHNSTVAVCLSFMFIVDIVCMCRMNCSLLYTTISVCCKFSTVYTSNIFVEKTVLVAVK